MTHDTKSITGRTADMNSFRREHNHESILTGINTYMYEIMAMPMRSSFMNSIKKRRKHMRNSIKEYNRTRDRSKSKSRTHELKYRPSKYVSQFERSRDESTNLHNNNSIFNNLSDNIKFKVSTSVDTTIRNYKGTTNWVNFKHLPDKMKVQMHDKVTEVLRKQNARIRNKTNDSFILSKDWRNEI